MSTGIAVSEDIATDLTTVQTVGKQWIENFESKYHQTLHALKTNKTEKNQEFHP